MQAEGYIHFLTVHFSSVSRQQPCTHEWRAAEKKWLLQQADLRARRVLGLLLLPGHQPDLRHRQCGQLRQHGDQLLRLLPRQHLQVRGKRHDVHIKGYFEKFRRRKYKRRVVFLEDKFEPVGDNQEMFWERHPALPTLSQLHKHQQMQ